MRLRLLPLLAVLVTATIASARPRGRRIAPRTGLIVTAGPRVGVPLVTNVNGEIGFVVRPADQAFASGKRHAVYLQPGASILWRGWRRSFSRERQLRGREDAWGPVGRGDPAKGDRIDVPVFGNVFGLSLSRKGGVGVYSSWIPLPVGGWPFVRGVGSVYLTHPHLRPISNKALDGVDWVTARVVRPLIRRFKPPAP